MHEIVLLPLVNNMHTFSSMCMSYLRCVHLFIFTSNPHGSNTHQLQLVLAHFLKLNATKQKRC